MQKRHILRKSSLFTPLTDIVYHSKQLSKRATLASSQQTRGSTSSLLGCDRWIHGNGRNALPFSKEICPQQNETKQNWNIITNILLFFPHMRKNLQNMIESWSKITKHWTLLISIVWENQNKKCKLWSKAKAWAGPKTKQNKTFLQNICFLHEESKLKNMIVSRSKITKHWTLMTFNYIQI